MKTAVIEPVRASVVGVIESLSQTKASFQPDPKKNCTSAARDNGPGMPVTLQQRLFSPFFTIKSAGKGTVMGLSISQQIITEKHHGHLKCLSQPGAGTEFVLQLQQQVGTVVV